MAPIAALGCELRAAAVGCGVISSPIPTPLPTKTQISAAEWSVPSGRMRNGRAAGFDGSRSDRTCATCHSGQPCAEAKKVSLTMAPCFTSTSKQGPFMLKHSNTVDVRCTLDNYANRRQQSDGSQQKSRNARRVVAGIAERNEAQTGVTSTGRNPNGGGKLDMAPPGCSRIKVDVSRPLGLVLQDDKAGNIWVEEVLPAGNAKRTGLVDVGDQLIAISAVVYNSIEDYNGVKVRKGMEVIRLNVRGEKFETVMAAIGTHPGHIKVTLELQKCKPSVNGLPSR